MARIQEFYVTRCCDCKIFQGKLVKKFATFQCKICNKKQILDYIFFHGAADDCRKVVKDLNFERLSWPVQKPKTDEEKHLDKVFEEESKALLQAFGMTVAFPRLELAEIRWRQFLKANNMSSNSPLAKKLLLDIVHFKPTPKETGYTINKEWFPFVQKQI